MRRRAALERLILFAYPTLVVVLSAIFLGKMLAEGGATTRQIMDTLGHTAIAHAELYSREADQAHLARQGMDAVVKLVASRKK